MKNAKHKSDRWDKKKWYICKSKSEVVWTKRKLAYFFPNLEKYRGMQKILVKNKRDDGTFSEDLMRYWQLQMNIIMIYIPIRITDTAVQDYFLDSLDKTLPERRRESCKSLITFEEVTKAIKGMASNTSSGCDGLSNKFHINTCYMIGKDLVEVFNIAYSEHTLPESQRISITTLVYKIVDNGWYKKLEAFISVACRLQKIYQTVWSTGSENAWTQ